ncbi:MAG: hypothetical protein ACH37Z_02755 [Anaerolineae bacterium]
MDRSLAAEHRPRESAITSTQIAIVLGLFLAAGCNPMLSPDSHLRIDPLLPEVAAFIAGDEDMFGFDDAPDLEASLTLGPVHSRLVPTEAF